ncbi:hypothetical protein KJ636_02610, partial [Patescibacteria group bacterium]|nr:hypothetical protein [Patescibacteria group bacterium]
GGAGGGAIIIEVNGSSTIDGTISANGQNGLDRIMYLASASGAGSGGSIYIQTNSLIGSGLITANGGNTDSAGAGGGGRIAVYYQQKDFQGDIQSQGGIGYQSGESGSLTIGLRNQ